MRHPLDCGQISKSAGRLRLPEGRTDDRGTKPNREKRGTRDSAASICTERRLTNAVTGNIFYRPMFAISAILRR